MMIDSLQSNPNNFPLQQVLQSLKKKNSSFPQIDFLLLQENVNQLQTIQQKTCEQIVQFVDEHCSEYMKINGKLQLIQTKLDKADTIIKEVNNRVNKFAKVYYHNESLIQQILNKYETSIVEKQLLIRCKQQSAFLSSFVMTFENIISKSMDVLNFKERSLLIRFCYKASYFNSLFSHHLLHQSLPEYLKVQELIVNLSDQVQFYISEQLSKLMKAQEISDNSNKNDPKSKSLQQIKLCYKYLNKMPEYYRNVEQSLIGRQMQIAQRNVVNNKLNLIAGKNIQVVEQYYKSIFCSIKQFPSEYPKKRLLDLIYSNLKKSELKFLYTYTLPIFPISYSAYLKCVQNLQQELRVPLSINHNWDLKRWVDVRQKNILDRSLKDWEKGGDISKWIDIVFKQNCKVQGVKSDVVKLSLKLIGKYSKFLETSNFSEELLSKYINVLSFIENLIKQKIILFFGNSQSNQKKECLDKLSTKIALSCKQTLQTSINKVVAQNTKTLISSCEGSLQPYKTFIMKIIKSSKQLTQYGVINTENNVFKPLNTYLSNSQTKLSQEAKQVIKEAVIKQVMKLYDSNYVSQVYQYSKSNLSVEQFSTVMEIVGKQRGALFNLNQAQKISDVVKKQEK